MPIIYKNNKPNMKQINEMTQEEAQFVISAQPLYSFTTEQAKQMTQIVRDYYDPNQQGCATCGSGLRTAKDSIVKLYKENTLFIDNKANGIETIQQEVIIPLTIETKKKKK